MSNLTKMTLRETVPLIAKLYESFGVRSMILSKNNEWINVVTVIQFTRRKVEDLSNEYQSLEERLGKIDDDNFKIVFQAKKIEEFPNVLAALENGYLNLGDLHTKLLASNPQKAVDQKINDYSYAARLGEYAEYNCYSVTVTMGDTPNRILSKSGICASAWGLRHLNDLARSWLGLDSLESSANVHMVLPIYAKVNKVQYQGGKEIKIPLKIDQRLLNGSCIWLTRKGPGDNVPILERRKYDAMSLDHTPQNGFAYTTLNHNFSGIGPNDTISVSLLHNELGLLDRQDTAILRILPEITDPLKQTFVLFDAGKKMEEYLLNPEKAEEFEASVYWLLEMVDIQSIKLRPAEAVREDKNEKGSADIIAYDPETHDILAIDCTTAVADHNKIDKIKNTAEYISRKIGLPVKAVVITARNCPTVKKDVEKNYVNIIDHSDLESMIGFYKNGSQYQAKRIILGT